MLQASLGTVEGIVLGFEGRLADKFPGDQASVAFAFGTGGGQFALGGGQLGARSVGGQLQVAGVESGQRLAGLDFAAGIDEAGSNLAANAEGEIDFVAGADFACIGCTLGGGRGGRLHEDDGWRRRWRIATLAAAQRHAGREWQQ